MGRVIDSTNLIKTNKGTYREGDTVLVKITNLLGIGSVIHFSGGKVTQPSGFTK